MSAQYWEAVWSSAEDLDLMAAHLRGHARTIFLRGPIERWIKAAPMGVGVHVPDEAIALSPDPRVQALLYAAGCLSEISGDFAAAGLNQVGAGSLVAVSQPRRGGAS